MDADLADCADGRTWKDRGAGGEKDPVLDDCAVDVRVWANEHVIAELGRAPTPATYERVLHDHGALAYIDPAVLSGQYCPEEDSRASADVHIAAQDRVWCHVCGRVNGRAGASMLDQHAPYLPGTDMAERCRRADHPDRHQLQRLLMPRQRRRWR